MRLLTATARGQGGRDNDYNWTIEGELVIPSLIVCRADADDPDGACGCGRGFGGLASHRATTTALIREVAGVSRADYIAAIRASLEDQGWGGEGADLVATTMIAAASALQLGVVIERRLDTIQVRRSQPHNEIASRDP
jgi:hypothetical protein